MRAHPVRPGQHVARWRGQALRPPDRGCIEHKIPARPWIDRSRPTHRAYAATESSSLGNDLQAWNDSRVTLKSPQTFDRSTALKEAWWPLGLTPPACQRRDGASVHLWLRCRRPIFAALPLFELPEMLFTRRERQTLIAGNDVHDLTGLEILCVRTCFIDRQAKLSA